MIGVCETPEQLEAAVQNLGAEFGGAGRIKNNFAVEDASYMFHLTTILLNVLVEFDCTFAQLAARPGVAEQWAAHIDAAERGNVPRAQWRREAEEAVALLRSDAYAEQRVIFIGEAQLMLRSIFQVRAHMHEVRALPPAAHRPLWSACRPPGLTTALLGVLLSLSLSRARAPSAAAAVQGVPRGHLRAAARGHAERDAQGGGGGAARGRRRHRA